MAHRLKQWARRIKADVIAVSLAARDPRVPWYVRALAIAVAGYALSPIDLIPDFVPILGFLDDVVIVPLGILAVVKLIPAEIMTEHRAAVEQAMGKPTGRSAAIMVVLVWAASLALVTWWSYRVLVPRIPG